MSPSPNHNPKCCFRIETVWNADISIVLLTCVLDPALLTKCEVEMVGY